jgi:hypothetical protein
MSACMTSTKAIIKKEWHLRDGTLPNTETNYLIINNLKLLIFTYKCGDKINTIPLNPQKKNEVKNATLQRIFCVKLLVFLSRLTLFFYAFDEYHYLLTKILKSLMKKIYC